MASDSGLELSVRRMGDESESAIVELHEELDTTGDSAESSSVRSRTSRSSVRKQGRGWLSTRWGGGCNNQLPGGSRDADTVERSDESRPVDALPGSGNGEEERQ